MARYLILLVTLALLSLSPSGRVQPNPWQAIPWPKLTAEASRLGKPEWRPMLVYLAELHRRSTHPARPPFPYPWEELGPGYPRRAFGHWDIVHIILDLLPTLPDHARNQLLNDLANQQPDGLIPGLIYFRGSLDAPETGALFNREAGHPPIWPLAAQELLHLRPDKQLLNQCYGALLRQIAWFEAHRRSGPGFFFSRTQWESGIDDDLRERYARVGKRSLPALDATCFVFLLYDIASDWARALGKPEESKALAAEAQRLSTYISTELFDPVVGFFYDSWAIKDRKQRIESFVGIWPLVAGAATAEQASRVIDEHLLNPRRFFTKHPISTIAVDAPEFQLVGWRGPSWNSMSLWAAKGCLRYGRADAAIQILERALDDSARHFLRTGTIWEFYHPHGGNPESLRREVKPPFGKPHRDYLGHNPLLAMARLWEHLRNRDASSPKSRMDGRASLPSTGSSGSSRQEDPRYSQLGGACYFRYWSGEAREKFAKMGPYADLMVSLRPRGDRFIFWWGASYRPFLDLRTKRVFVEPSVPLQNAGDALSFDPVCKHAHVRLLEDSPARVRILWRYAPDLTKTDPQWWTEEIFTIYPDGSCYRAIMEGTADESEYEDPAHFRLEVMYLTPEGIRKVPTDKVKSLQFRASPETFHAFEVLGYDEVDGTYALATRRSGYPGAARLRATSEMLHPRIKIQGWGNAEPQITLNGSPFTAFRTGTYTRPDNNDLILWLAVPLERGDEIIIRPGAGGKVWHRRPPSDPYARRIPDFPTGSPDPGPFGAYYTTLRYWREWDHQWRTGEYADVVVQFDRSPDRLVFWRGTSYVPHWVNERNIWYNNEFCERRAEDFGLEGLCEPMQDHECRFSRVRILQNSPARAVVHWRYGLTTLEHLFCGLDSRGWGDWVDDYYYVYPDETCVRDTTLYTVRPDAFNEWHEAIPLVNPGKIPEQVLEPTTLVLANAAGRLRAYDFSQGFPPNSEFEDGLNIVLVRVKGQGKPFAIAESTGQWFDPVSRPDETRYNHYDDWPAWPRRYRKRTWERDPTNNYRVFWRFLPSHSSLMHLDWDTYAADLDGPVTWLRKILLNGMLHTDDVKDLIPLARFWENAPYAQVSGHGFSPARFDKAQKAYVFERRFDWVEGKVNRKDDRHPDQDAKTVTLHVLASPDRPLVNPCFIIRNWPPDRAPRVFIDGKAVRRGIGFRAGIEKYWKGWELRHDLVVWISCQRESPTRVTIEMAGPDSDHTFLR